MSLVATGSFCKARHSIKCMQFRQASQGGEVKARRGRCGGEGVEGKQE